MKTIGWLRYTSRVELSSKVIDNELRLRCTLLHELCHVAAWTLDHVRKPPHGPHFKLWASRYDAPLFQASLRHIKA